MFDPGKGLAVAVWTTAPVAVLWTLLADPAQWPRWAPHLGAVDRPGDRTGPVALGEHLVHELLDEEPGHRVRVSMRIHGPLAVIADRTALLAYAPAADLAVRRLARIAGS